jgi:hypothetical protein
MCLSFYEAYINNYTSIFVLVYRQITLIQEIFSAVFVTLALPAKRNQGADSDLSLREALLKHRNCINFLLTTWSQGDRYVKISNHYANTFRSTN